jgi:hypothetical protein
MGRLYEKKGLVGRLGRYGLMLASNTMALFVFLVAATVAGLVATNLGGGAIVCLLVVMVMVMVVCGVVAGLFAFMVHMVMIVGHGGLSECGLRLECYLFSVAKSSLIT